jgi:hypothetical protein
MSKQKVASFKLLSRKGHHVNKDGAPVAGNSKLIKAAFLLP